MKKRVAVMTMAPVKSTATQMPLIDVAGHGGNYVDTSVAALPTSAHATKRPAWRVWRLLLAKGPLTRSALCTAMLREFDMDTAQVDRAIAAVERTALVTVAYTSRRIARRKQPIGANDVLAAAPETGVPAELPS
jgi:hypothetical protein